MRVFARALVAVAVTLTVGFPPQATGEVPTGPVVSGETGAKVDELLSRLAGFGYSGAVIVAKDGEVILSKGYGLADRKNNVAVTPQTVFTIGSITKQFTAAAILKLEMAGRLSVEDPISKYFDDAPADKAGITIHHLLTHTAGFPDAIGRDFDVSSDRERFVELALQWPLLSVPGQRYRYSNVGYSLLGIIIEKVTGTGYEQFLVENLFKPAGMNRTGYLLPEYRDDELAIGYQGDEPWGAVIRKPMLPDGPSWHLRANGGIHSTTLDMYRWYRALQGDTVLSPDAKRKMYTSHVPEGPGADSFYGYGWAIFTTPRNTKLIAHNGGNGIFSADFRQYVDDGLMLFHACNVAGLEIDGLSAWITGTVFGRGPELPPKVVAMAPAELSAHNGTYAIEGKPSIEVEAGAGALRFTPYSQEGLSAMSPGTPLAELAARLANERTLDLFGFGGRPDRGEVSRERGGPAPSPTEDDEFSELWKELGQRWGEVLGIAVLGSRPHGRRMIATAARLQFEHGMEYVQFLWLHKSLRRIEPLAGPPAFSFRPVSPNEFACMDLATGQIRRVTFDKDDSGKAVLSIQAHTGRVTATRSGS